MERASSALSPSSETKVRTAREADTSAILALDAQAFGADRSPMLLPLFSEHGALLACDGSGYAVVRPVADGAIVGPLIAAGRATATVLFAAALTKVGARKAMFFVPSGNRDALLLAAERGFMVRRELRHMIRGDVSPPSLMLFGRANLGQG